MSQTVINPVYNHNLVSTYYLTTLIERAPEWRKNDHIAAFSEVKHIFNRESAFLEQYNEKQLEDHFFKPIFEVLGFEYEVTTTTRFKERPDFAFFADRESLSAAHQNWTKGLFYSNALAIGEVKRWTIDLDRFGKDGYNRNTNPSLQLWMYLHDTEPKWGILSNGLLWRLYCKERRRDEYLEVNLPSIIVCDDVNTFRFFYYFFRKEAFIPTKDGDPFLDRVLKGSADYAQEIGEDLKQNVYQAMKKVAEGFVAWDLNQLNPSDPATLWRVQKNTMILLYRFLFLLYGEGKGLLDLDNPLYRESYSFSHLKKEVKERIEGPAHLRYLPSTRSLYTSLRDLFQLIDKGSIPLGIPKELCDLPAYNGDLFNSQKHPDLEQWRIGDSYLAEAIDLLSRRGSDEGPRDFVDYSTLEIRHLGSIYEGLLEYKLKVAESDLVASGKEWATLEDYNRTRKQKKELIDFNESERVGAGSLYLVTDKGKRRSTGSYYTPDYIVKYIVENTIGPIVEEKWKEAQAANQRYVDATLSIKVLDPAMGSGHFLVGAVEYLAQKLLEAVQEDLRMGETADASSYTTEWARRAIVSHCIYGVDLNELAVELAKVSLWLTTISKDKPLSFLDHRLKQGNSLIGANITDLAWYHEGDSKRGTPSSQKQIIPPVIVDKILNKINTIESTSDNNLDDIKTKERLFLELQDLPEYQKIMQIADLNTSFYFGNRIEKTEYRIPASYYYDLIASLLGDDAEWKTRTRYPWFKRALVMGKDRSFFHYELEFPEIFFEAGRLRANPGWDAVIGNPPYGATFSNEETTYLAGKFLAIASGELESYLLFYHRALLLLSNKGRLSFITPDGWLTNVNCNKFRSWLAQNYSLIDIFDWYKPFVDAKDTRCHSIIIGNKIAQANIRVQQVLPSNPVRICRQYDLASDLLVEWGGNQWLVYISPAERPIMDKIRAVSQPLGSLFNVKYGLRTGNNKKYLSENAGLYKVVEGKNIGRYYRSSETNFLTKTDGLPKSYFGDEKSLPKLLVQYVRSNSTDVDARWLESTYCDIECIPLNSLNSIYKKDEGLDLKYLLAVLNSYLMNRYYRLHYTDVNVKKTYLMELPIVRIDSVEQQNIIEKVDLILNNVNEELKKKEEFVGAITYKLGIQKPSHKVCHFYKYSFEEFMKEIEKTSGPKTPKEIAYWRNAFDEYKCDIGKLVSEITSLEREIDDLVFKLYHITDDRERDIIKKYCFCQS